MSNELCKSDFLIVWDSIIKILKNNIINEKPYENIREILSKLLYHHNKPHYNE